MEVLKIQANGRQSKTGWRLFKVIIEVTLPVDANKYAMCAET